MKVFMLIVSLGLLLMPAADIGLGSIPFKPLGQANGQNGHDSSQSARGDSSDTATACSKSPDPQVALKFPTWAWSTELTACDSWQGREEILPGIYFTQAAYGLTLAVEQRDDVAPHVGVDPQLHLFFRIGPPTPSIDDPSASAD